MSQFAASLNLADLDGTNGFRIFSTSEYDYAGWSVASTGDINGDGFLDLIIGAPNRSDAYVVLGGATALADLDALDGSDGAIDLANLDGSNGFVVQSFAPALGVSVSSAGDVNNDTYDDFLIGGAGYTLLLFGNGDPFQAVYDDSDIGDLDGSNGYIFLSPYGGFGISSANIGDINGDGIADMVMGAPSYAYGPSLAYVVFGGTTNLAALDAADGDADGTIDPRLVDGSTGVRIRGENDGSFGFSVKSAGDVDGDGFDDVIVGDFYNSKAYIIFGRHTFNDHLVADNVNGHNGYEIDAPVPALGFSVSTIGDFNADGYADVAMTTPAFNGATLVLFGGHDLKELDASDGSRDGHLEFSGPPPPDTAFLVTDSSTGTYTGWSVSSAGDVNGDGFDDMIIGAPYSYGANGGAYVVFGQAHVTAPSGDLAFLDGDSGFKIFGSGTEYAGWSVATAGDLNGDGFDDLLVGAPYSSGGDDYAGASYVIYGHKPDEAVTRVGTDIGNTIHGSDFDDVLKGLKGDDTLIGHDGRDSLQGGKGNDTLIGGAGADRLGADVGVDTLVFNEASDSAGAAYDTAWDFDASVDKFDLWFTMTGMDATVDSNLNRLEHNLDASHLEADHAVLVNGPNGRLYLVIDANSTAGYQDGFDLLIQLKDVVHPEAIDTATFI